MKSRKRPQEGNTESNEIEKARFGLFPDQAAGLPNIQHSLLRAFAALSSIVDRMRPKAPPVFLGALMLAGLAPAANADSLDAESAARFAQLALECVHREYPNKIAHVLQSDADVKPPRELTPAFFGCYDWHSSVHGHWLLARVARLFPDAPIATQARTALARSLTDQHIAIEAAYLRGAGRTSFERPYGLAWLLQLAAELRAWNDPQARAWSKALAPLESEAAARLKQWLPNLRYPIREGEHDQTAFCIRAGLGLGEACRRRRHAAAAARKSAAVLCAGSGMSPCLRTVGPGLPVAVSRRGGLHAARSRPARIRGVAR